MCFYRWFYESNQLESLCFVVDLEFLLMILSMKYFYKLNYLDSHLLHSHLLHSPIFASISTYYSSCFSYYQQCCCLYYPFQTQFQVLLQCFLYQINSLQQQESPLPQYSRNPCWFSQLLQQLMQMFDCDLHQKQFISHSCCFNSFHYPRPTHSIPSCIDCHSCYYHEQHCWREIPEKSNLI